jgi:hypothetical protein
MFHHFSNCQSHGSSSEQWMSQAASDWRRPGSLFLSRGTLQRRSQLQQQHQQHPQRLRYKCGCSSFLFLEFLFCKLNDIIYLKTNKNII